MRSNLLKSMLSVFALAVALLFVGTLAMADGPKISGAVSASFGILNWDTGVTPAPAVGDAGKMSTYSSGIESNLVVSGKNDQFDYYYRLRIRGTEGDTISKSQTEGTYSTGTVQTARTRIGWEPTANFRLEMGKLPSIGGIGQADFDFTRAPSEFRFNTDNYGLYDVGSLDVDYHTPTMRIGIGLGTECDQGLCQTNPGADGLATQAKLAKYGANTMIIFGQFKIGSAFIGLRNESQQAENAAGDKYKGSATVVEGNFAAGPAKIFLEYTTTVAKDGAPTNAGPDLKTTAPMLGVQFGDFQAQYSSTTTKPGVTGVSDGKLTVMSVGYYFSVPGGRIGPEYFATSDKAAGPGTQPEAKGTLLRVAAATSF